MPPPDDQASPPPTAPAPPDGEGTLGRRATRGSAWVVMGYGASQVLRFGSNLVLTRLLFPQAFGLMLLVGVFLLGLQMVSDVGIGASVVQNERTDQAFLDTAWTLQILRGVVLWLAACLLAWPAAQLYGEPLLVAMLPVAGLGAVLDGLTSTALYTVNRKLMMARFQLVELASQAAGALVMIAGAWLTRSVWALLAGSLASGAARCALSHLALPGPRNALRWDRPAAGALLQFGQWVFLSSMLTFLAQQGDRLFFGKMIPLAELGVYNIALSLADAPAAVISGVAFRVLFPAIAEYRRDGRPLAAGFARATAPLALLAGAGAIGLVVAGPALIDLLYDRRYAGAGWILRLVALGIWVACLVHVSASVVLACGRTRALAAAHAVRLAWIVAVVPALFHQWGFAAALVGVICSDLPRYLVLARALRREGVPAVRLDLGRTAGLAASLALGMGALRLLDGLHPLLGASLAASAGLAAWGLANRGQLRELLGKVAAARARRAVAGA
jgi:O-antigen/teichoic acid export membrane protein